MSHSIDRRAFLTGAAAVVACSSRPGIGFEGNAFVANEEGRSLAVVNLASFSLSRHIRLDAGPTAVIANPSRPTVYALTPGTGTVHEVDTASMELKRRVKLAHTAHSMRLAPDGQSLWVLLRDSRQLAEVTLDRFEVSRRIRLPSTPEDFDIGKDDRIAVSFPAERKIGLATLKSAGIESTIPTGPDPRTVRFRSDGRLVLAGNRGDRTITVGDVASARIVTHLPLAVDPENFCFKADGGVLFVSGAGMDAVASIFPYRNMVAETILAGRTPGAMAASSGTVEFLFVANTESGDVTIIDIETSKVRAVVSVGVEPACIAFTPDQRYALVLNRQSGDMAVIRVAAVRDKRTRPAPPPLFTMIRVGSKPVSAAVRAT